MVFMPLEGTIISHKNIRSFYNSTCAANECNRTHTM